MISKSSNSSKSIYAVDFSFENSLDKSIETPSGIKRGRNQNGVFLERSLDIANNDIIEKTPLKQGNSVKSENKSPTVSIKSSSIPTTKEDLVNYTDDKSSFYHILQKENFLNDTNNIKMKKKVDRNKLILKLLPNFLFSIFTLLYMSVLFVFYFPEVSQKEMDHGRYGFIVNSIILVIVPWGNFSCSRNFQYFLCYITGLISISCILNIQFLLPRESLTSYFMIVCIYRIFVNLTVYDNVALIAIYIDDLHTFENFHSSDMYIVGSMLVALLFRSIITKIKQRINENVLVHIILKEKNEQELISAQLLLSAHLPDDLIGHMFPHHIDHNQSFHFNTSITFNKNIIDQCVSIDEKKNELADQARELDLLLEFQETKPTLKELQSLTGVNKSSTVVIAIKESLPPSRDSMLDSTRTYCIYDLIDWLALSKRVTCIRKFGSTWIGCVGLIQTWGTREEDLYNALLLCCEINKLATHYLWNITCAIDSGLITGGFIGNKFFDLYGPEVRWILSVVNSNMTKEILVSQTVEQSNLKTLTNVKYVFIPVDMDNFDSMIQNRADLDVYSLSNIDDINNLSSFNPDDTMHQYDIYRRARELKTKKESKNDEEGTNQDASFLTVSDIYYNDYSKSDDYWNYFWCDHICDEFLTTVKDRYGVDIDDPVLRVYNSVELSNMKFDLKSRLFYIVYQNYRDKIKSFFATICYPMSWYENIASSCKSFINIFSANDNHKIFSNGTIEKELIFESPLTEFYNVFYNLGVTVENNTNNNGVINADNDLFNNNKDFSNHTSDTLNDFANSIDHDTPPLIKSPSQKDVTRNSTFEENIEKNKTSQDWHQYNIDIRMYKYLSQNDLLSIGTVLFSSLVILIQINHIEDSNNTIELLNYLIFFNIIFPFLFQRKYDLLIFMVLIPTRMFILYKLPGSLFEPKSQNNLWMNVGNELNLIVLFFFMLPVTSRIEVKYLFIDHILCNIPLFFNSSLIAQRTGQFSLFLYNSFFILRVALSIIIEYECYMSYILEHIILPHSIEIYHKQQEQKRLITKEYYPNDYKNVDKNKPKHFEKVAIVTVHIKAADVLRELLPEEEMYALLKPIYEKFSSAVTKCGLINISSFSGVCVAVAYRGGCSDDVINTRSSYKLQAVNFLRVLQLEIESFSQSTNISVSIGMGLTHGSATVGFLGNDRYCYDVSGLAKDQSYTLATLDEGIYASSIFKSSIKNFWFQFNSKEFIIGENTISELHVLKLAGQLSGMEINDFEPLSLLGKGGYGTVYLCKEKATGTEYAVKQIEIKKDIQKLTSRSDIPKAISRELWILQKIKHINVVNFKYCILTKSRMTLVMDYIKGGNLKQIIDRDGDKITLSTLRLWFAELVIALEYIHSLNIIHRDVKPANCMIQIDGHLKLADFGLSIIDANNLTYVGMSDQATTVDCTDYTMVKLQKLFPLKPNATVSRKIIFLADSDPNQTVEKILKKKYDVRLVKHNISVAQYFHSKKKFMNVAYSAIIINMNLFNNVSPNLSQSQSTGEGNTQVGLNLIEEFFNHEKFKDIPIISLVLDSQTTELINLQDKCIEKGASEVITLPFTKNKEIILDQTIDKQEDKFFNKEVKFEEQGLLEKFANNDKIETVEDNPPSQSDVPLHSVGTPNFMAPEIINTRSKNKSSIVYTKSNDWWSCGVTFYECVMKEKLFPGADKNEVFKSINQVLNLGNLEKESKLLFDLVSGLLIKDPLQRLDSIGIKMHPFFQSHEQIIHPTSPTIDSKSIKIKYDSIHWDVLPTNESPRPYKPTQLPLKPLSKEQKLIFRNKFIKKDSNLSPNKKKKQYIFVHEAQRKSWIKQSCTNVNYAQCSNSTTTKSINYSSLNCVEEVSDEFLSNAS